MKYVLKVTVAITLLPLLIAVSYLPSFAQNTAPVPTTFEILSPGDSNATFLTNLNYGTGAGQNNRIFYGGDFANSTAVYGPFLGFQDANNDGLYVVGEKKARGNFPNTRLTLGGTVYNNSLSGASYNRYVVDLPGLASVDNDAVALTSFDSDVTGSAASVPWYKGANGFVAINEEDSLVIRLNGVVDPNNFDVSYVSTATSDYNAKGTYTPLKYETKSYAFDIANPVNDSANGARFGIVPSTLPAGATFNTNLFVWVPNFIQGDGTFDNSLRNGTYFVDANISNGTTTSQTALGVDDTVLAATVGQGLGELRDSLYVIYFTATDDGIPPMTGMDSLFILVNDSIANPPPVFTKHDVVRPSGVVQSYKASVDSALHYSEGDSIQISYYASDQDSLRGGGLNQALDFEILDWSGFIHRTGSATDSLALRVDTLKTGTVVTGFKVRLQVAYNVADTLGAGDPDTLSLQVRVNDESNNADTSLIRFVIANINRAPIWDPDTSSKPRDSTLTYAFDPAAVDADSVPAFSPLAVTNGAVDSIYFPQYTYDPDPLIQDSLGPALTFSTTSSIGTVFNQNGLLVVNLAFEDTVSFAFPITVTDTDPTDPKSATITLSLRVAPEPDVSEIYPASGYAGQDITIFGNGFGLLDINSDVPSRVIFRARNSSGVAQNFAATINSWSRDRINITIPGGVPVSRYTSPPDVRVIPDTIAIYSSVFSIPTYYPYVITAADTNTVFNMEVTNITSTSATFRWRTAFAGGDSLILAAFSDTLQINTVAGITPAPQYTDEAGGTNYYPVFVNKAANGTATTNVVTPITVKGVTQTTDQIHSVTLTNLAPGTKYRVLLAMDNRLFFGDSSGNLNGPYKPAKINRNLSANTAKSAFRFETAPASNNNGEAFAVHGKVFTSNSAAFGALVTVQIVDKDNLADTTLALNAIVASDSTWSVNLGDALTDTTGTVDRQYQHKEGDYLIVTITADKDDGYTKFVTTRATTSPQSVPDGNGEILLQPVVNYDMRLKVGLNLIGIPVNLFSTEPQTAKQLLGEITAGTPSITRYVTATSSLETIIRTISAGANAYIGASDWNLADANGNYYDAYFISVDGLEFVELSGSIYGDNLTPKDFPSAGYYWFARPAQSSSVFYAWSARSVLANVLNSVELFRFNEDTQNYENAYIDPVSGTFGGTDFHIDASEGYIIQVTAASQWDMNTPAAVALAATSEKFNGADNSASASLTLDVSKAVTTAATVSSIRLTDVTSSAAKVTWVGNNSMATQIRYGKANQGITHVVDYAPGEFNGSVGAQVITGLEPATDYVYEIVANGVTYNDNGKPFAFSTTKIGIGNPYTLFGRLVDESGKPLTGAMVFVEAKRDNDVSRMIAAYSDETGSWNVNLANLKMANGEVFEWKSGDELRIAAVYGSASTSFRTLVTGQSPQNVVRVSDSDGTALDNNNVARVALPKAFALGQNYPNPFNPSTTIAYDIPDNQTSAVQVELKVYNVRGQVVKTLVNEPKESGHYVVQWNGHNETGESVSSGVYFYRIKAGDFVTTRKMVLLK